MTDEAAVSGRQRIEPIWKAIRPFVNASLVLALALALTGLWFVNSARTLVDDTLNDVKFGVIKELDEEANGLVAEIREGVSELHALRTDISRIADNPSDLVDQDTRDRIKEIQTVARQIALDLDRMASGHMNLSQDTLEKLAVSLVHAYGKIRGCTAPDDGVGTQGG